MKPNASHISRHPIRVAHVFGLKIHHTRWTCENMKVKKSHIVERRNNVKVKKSHIVEGRNNVKVKKSPTLFKGEVFQGLIRCLANPHIAKIYGETLTFFTINRPSDMTRAINNDYMVTS